MDKIITEEFLAKYKGRQPNWGYNGLGYAVYKRTYARPKENGTTEEWYETVARCINGAQEIGAEYTKEQAELLYDKMFNLKCSFAGRMLWMLGTEHVKRWGMNAVINCFGIVINELESFCFLFENLMLGGGVGFSVSRKDIYELPKVKMGVEVSHLKTKDADFIVPDSREGWVNLLRKVLRAYFEKGKSFSYSTILVRGYGEKIHGLGGTASGPQILVDGITNICKVIKLREGKKLRSIDVLDICNIISSIVVSGNIRRSATISIGDPDDYLFLRAKRWDLGTIPNWRSASNNTLYIDNFSHVQKEVWEGYNGNGEPYGFFNLPLSRKYGRLGEVRKDNCEILNPCVTGDTLILTKRYGNIRISSCVGKKVSIWNGHEWSEVYVRITGYFQKCRRIELKDGRILRCTNRHKFILNNGEKIEAQYLKKGNVVTEYIDPYGNLVEKSKVISNEDIGIEREVYCFTEPKVNQAVFNGILTGQCGEITLADGEVCCLSEIFLNNIESKEELETCAKLLYKTQKAICANNFLHEKTNAIVHKNFRIGISISGVCQSIPKLDWLDDVYKHLRMFDKDWSSRKGYPESIKLTTLKPSGSISILSGSTPGVHPAYSKYYIRRVRMSTDDALVRLCREAGYKTELVENFDGTKDHKTTIVEFPCYAGENVIEAKDMPAIQQLELVKRLLKEWADNSISVTVYYKKEELHSIREWLKNNYEDNIKSVSFLLHSEHGFKQAPYEEVTKERYEELVRKIRPLTAGVTGDAIAVEECEGGACPIK